MPYTWISQTTVTETASTWNKSTFFLKRYTNFGINISLHNSSTFLLNYLTNSKPNVHYSRMLLRSILFQQYPESNNNVYQIIYNVTMVYNAFREEIPPPHQILQGSFLSITTPLKHVLIQRAVLLIEKERCFSGFLSGNIPCTLEMKL